MIQDRSVPYINILGSLTLYNIMQWEYRAKIVLFNTYIEHIM